LAITNFSGEVVIAQGATLELWAVFNGSDPSVGGTYNGPTVFAGTVTNPYGQTITTLNYGVEFIAQTSDLTSSCTYFVSLRNDGTQDNTVNLDGFYDG